MALSFIMLEFMLLYKEVLEVIDPSCGPIRSYSMKIIRNCTLMIT
jgi:hypothetical protein